MGEWGVRWGLVRKVGGGGGQCGFLGHLGGGDTVGIRDLPEISGNFRMFPEILEVTIRATSELEMENCFFCGKYFLAYLCDAYRKVINCRRRRSD